MGRNIVPARALPVPTNVTCIIRTVDFFSNAVSSNEKAEAEQTHPSQPTTQRNAEGCLAFVAPPYDNSEYCELVFFIKYEHI